MLTFTKMVSQLVDDYIQSLKKEYIVEDFIKDKIFKHLSTEELVDEYLKYTENKDQDLSDYEIQEIVDKINNKYTENNLKKLIDEFFNSIQNKDLNLSKDEIKEIVYDYYYYKDITKKYWKNIFNYNEHRYITDYDIIIKKIN